MHATKSFGQHGIMDGLIFFFLLKIIIEITWLNDFIKKIDFFRNPSLGLQAKIYIINNLT